MARGTSETRLLREAIILAAEACGSDGQGKDGLLGYLVNAAQTQPKSFLALMGRVIPLQVAPPDTEEVVYETIEAATAAFKARGLPVPTLLLEAVRKTGNGSDPGPTSYQ